MPGILPSSANFRSMMRLMRNLRYTPRERPVSSHRRMIRVEYLGFRWDLAICALVVMLRARYRGWGRCGKKLVRGHAGVAAFSAFGSGLASGLGCSGLGGAGGAGALARSTFGSSLRKGKPISL